VADVTEKRELAGCLVGISQAPCGICRGRASGQCLEDNDSEGRLTFSDDDLDGSQLPY
jgi:hypothetical protein